MTADVYPSSCNVRKPVVADNPPMRRVGRGTEEAERHAESDRLVAMAMVGTGASAAFVLVSTVCARLGVLRGTLPALGPEAFVDAVVMAGLLFGLHRRSRVAAIALFFWFLGSRVWLWVNEPAYVGKDAKLIMFDLFVSGAAFAGIVGAFRWHRERQRSGPGRSA